MILLRAIIFVLALAFSMLCVMNYITALHNNRNSKHSENQLWTACVLWSVFYYLTNI